MTETLQIESLLPWSKPKMVETKRGHKILRTCKPTEDFWNLWRSGKNQLVAAGVGVGKHYQTGEWEATWWQDPPKEFTERLNANIAGSQAVDAHIEIPAPQGLDYLPYQKAGIAFCSDKIGSLIGDEMGLGKTIQAIGFLNLKPEIRKVLIVCPASLRINWLRELQKWLVHQRVISIAEPGLYPGMSDIVIINYDIVGKFDFSPLTFDAVIVDEAHFMKSKKAKRTIAIKAIKSKYRLALTGTPIPNRPLEIFEIVNWLQPQEFPNLYRFAFKYCGATKGAFGLEFEMKEDSLQKLQTKLRSTCMVRRLKKDVLKELPAKRRQVIEIASDDPAISAETAFAERHRDEMDKLRAALELAKVSDDDEAYAIALKQLRAGVHIAFEEMAKIRCQTALAKIPLTIAHLKQCQEAGTPKIVVFCHHRECIERFQAELGHAAVHHYGGMDDAEKQASVDRFQNDPTCLWFIGSLKASGVGITLTAASHVVFHEEDWVPGTISQAEDRCHRIGQTDSVLVQHLVLEGSIDATMAKRTIEKQEVIDRALDLDRDALKLEPIVPISEKVIAVTITKREIDERAPKITQDQIHAVHRGLKMLAGVCDGAMARDDMGFSGVDVHIGHSLAEQLFLTAKQAVLGQKLCRKYRRQLPEELLAIAL